MKICNFPSSFPKITFRNNETCLSCNHMLLFWKHLSHRKKPLTLITFTTNMISKIFCPLSPKSQSMTCFDNGKRAQIKHNKV